MQRCLLYKIVARQDNWNEVGEQSSGSAGMLPALLDSVLARNTLMHRDKS